MGTLEGLAFRSAADGANRRGWLAQGVTYAEGQKRLPAFKDVRRMVVSHDKGKGVDAVRNGFGDGVST